ncbi:MAG: amidohydrolase, partial [Candidatus Rokubacteria bacterium]|nr:amidohydrolase [Candidatus Rokubacteria bacterium]
MKNGFRVMDSDLHTMEPDGLWERYLEERFRKLAPTFARSVEGSPNQPTIRIGDLAIGEFTMRPTTARAGGDLYRRTVAKHPHNEVAIARGYDAESHLQAMDIEGIDVAILYGTRGRQVLMHDDLDPELAAALARAHNNWTRDYCGGNPEWLKFAAQIAFHDVDWAVKEARRAVRELGAVAVIGNPNPVKGRHIHDADFEPLWDAIEELGVPVGFHPTGISSLRDDIARRLLDHPSGRAIGSAARNPMELMLAFASLAAGGVLERHPKLRCAFLEGTCGWLPWWLWRLDEIWEKFGPGSDVKLSALPGEYFFRQCFVATDADEKVLQQVVEAVGDDNIVVSTDYPHSDGLFPNA